MSTRKGGNVWADLRVFEASGSAITHLGDIAGWYRVDNSALLRSRDGVIASACPSCVAGEVHYNRYSVDGAAAFATDRTVMTGLDTWHLSIGMPAVAAMQFPTDPEDPPAGDGSGGADETGSAGDDDGGSGGAPGDPDPGSTGDGASGGLGDGGIPGTSTFGSGDADAGCSCRSARPEPGPVSLMLLLAVCGRRRPRP